MALIEARGAVVSKNALMARVWPGRVVEENNLQSHISALRAALGRDREVIRTVSGRGYQFVGEILALPEGGDDRASLGPKAADPGALPPTNVPEPVSELIGREDELAEVVNLMGAHRLVTLTGAGGIGKTRLAVALARELRPHFADGVAAAVGLELGGEASVQNVAQRLAGRRLLLVLDTCEHVIEIAASMAEAALGAGPELRILATSRELLKAGRMGLPGIAAGRADSGGRARGFCRIWSDPAVPGAREGGQPAFCAGSIPRRVDRGDLPAARRHAAGDRVGGGTRLGARCRGNCRPPR